MAELFLDITDGTRLVENADDSVDYTVVCLLGGLSGDAAATLAAAAANITTTTSDGRRIPRRYETHPFVAGIVCLTREFECVDNDPSVVRITCRYGVPRLDQTDPSDTSAPPQIEGGATVQEVETELDAAGNIITVTFTPPLQPGEVGPPAPVTQTGKIRKQIPIVYLRFSWRQTGSPGDKALFHVGTMNADNFQNLPPKTWLCSAITFNSTDLGITWNVTAEFLYNPDTWDGVVAWIAPETNRIPIGATLTPNGTNGLRKIVIYKSSNFADIFI